jgi:hypothetical protein
MESPLVCRKANDSYRGRSRWESMLSPPRGGFFIAGFDKAVVKPPTVAGGTARLPTAITASTLSMGANREERTAIPLVRA